MKTTTAVQDLRVRIFSEVDWASYYGPAQRLSSEIEDIFNEPCPFYKNKSVKETHFAFTGMPKINGDPLTVAKWLELHPADSQPRFSFSQNPWHFNQPHTDTIVLEPRLYIVLREIVPGSTNNTSEEQIKMLPPGYEVPSTITEVTKDILVYRRTGKRCNGSCWAACSERTVQTELVSAGRISCVGFFNGHGLGVVNWFGHCHNGCGVGASRILNLYKI